ncbi:hypothetical protein METHB2_140004 [Candidatus Methylobacter favarea]|uniref:Uncharacterized protein n=1 Tax=Candidatus Methylobacter favarea TaxID=2707345 RepID=A0A8S0XR82_9GAMM|nr:hypothetical protein METHB2_140004 [Candidatus Methylobacter favarea]
MSYGQLTHYLSASTYTFKDLLGEVKGTVRQIEQEEDGSLFYLTYRPGEGIEG